MAIYPSEAYGDWESSTIDIRNKNKPLVSILGDKKHFSVYVWKHTCFGKLNAAGFQLIFFQSKFNINRSVYRGSLLGIWDWIK